MDFVDSYRHENPTRQSYSFWSYRSGSSSINALLSLPFLSWPTSLSDSCVLINANHDGDEW
jgi:exonuclease III